MRRLVPSISPPFAERRKNSGLPPPLRPNTRSTSSGEDDLRGSLSDYSDYESSDEETHKNAPNTASSSNGYSGQPAYPGASDLGVATRKAQLDEDDPFADPFGDGHGVDHSGSI